MVGNIERKFIRESYSLLSEFYREIFDITFKTHVAGL